MVYQYGLSKYAAMMSAVLIPIGTIMGITMALNGENSIIQYYGLAIASLGVGLTFIILTGYYKISQIYESNFLKMTIFLSGVFAITTIGILIWNQFFRSALSTVLSFVNIAITGIIYILFGVAFLKVDKLKSERRRTIAILYIIMGGLQASILFLFLAPFLAIAVRIMEFLFFGDINKYK